ncbi:MAG: hypothetical protein JO044_09325 [Mycobacteriaceae bacterium]|nr:hypothetical protein [Mycobacteriaceae bacterium]MBV9641340.1 hypothetical protein [Mycobacteriaceae bacterium]
MTELIFERDYAREMLFAAIRRQGDGTDEMTALVEQAAEVGCSRTQLAVELAVLAAQLFDRSAPEDRVALAREIVDVVAC